MSTDHDTNQSDKVPVSWSYFLDDPTAPVPPELYELVKRVRAQRQAARQMLEFQRTYRKMGSIKEILAAFEEAKTVSGTKVI